MEFFERDGHGRCVPTEPDRARDPFGSFVREPHTNTKQQALHHLTTMRDRDEEEITTFSYIIFQCCTWGNTITFDVNTRDLERIRTEVENEFSLLLCMGTHSRLGAD